MTTVLTPLTDGFGEIESVEEIEVVPARMLWL